MEDEKFFINHQYLNVNIGRKHELLEASSDIAYHLNFSNEKYWPEGGVGKLIERCGGYLNDVIYGEELNRVQPNSEPDFWYSLFIDSKKDLMSEQRVEHFRKIFVSVNENNDTLFYKGLRTLDANSEADSNILAELRAIETAAGDQGRQIITDLQLLKGILNPSDAARSIIEEGYEDRFKGRFFVRNVLQELLETDLREVCHADLKAFSKIHLVHDINQDIADFEVGHVLVHILNAYENKCDWFKTTAQITNGIVKTISALKDALPLDVKWCVGLSQESLQTLAMGGVNIHEKLTLQSRSQVFCNDLNI